MKPTQTLLIVLLLGAMSCYARTDKVEVIEFSDLQELMESQSSELLVVNFWATWCAPCVKELHQFDELLEKHKDKDLKVVLVSFDFANQLAKKVIPFVEKRQIKSDVVLLGDTDYNSFIDKIDPSWSGAIPATLIIDNRKNKKGFYEKEFKDGELEKTFTQFIN